MPEAARLLETTIDAIRKRVQRDTIPYEKDAGGRVWILLDAVGQRPDSSSELLDELRERIRYLERQLDQEREARTEERRRQDTIIAQLSAANAEQARTIRQLEPPSPAPSPAPSALRVSWEEGGKEATRLLAGGIVGLFVFIPSSVIAVISFFNNTTTLAVLTTLLAISGALTGLVGIYFGIKASAEASEGVQRLAEEANAEAERAAQVAQEGQREGG